jgi:predicted DNA-binding protein (MmcQ/YjbR family)
VVSIALPEHQKSSELGARLQRAGYLLSYNSDYLRRRNWIQICLMGEYSPEKLDSLLAWLAKHAAPNRNTASVPMTVAN